MNIKKTAKKIVAVGAGFGLAGATLMGALAAAPDLAQYPSDFIEDGQFDGKIVVGADANAQDIIGAIDIAASLQAASSSPIEGAAPGTSIEGDAKQIAASGDILEVGESLRDVVEVMTDDDLEMLRSGTVSTRRGSSSYTQTLEFSSDLGTNDHGVVGVFQRQLSGADHETGTYLKFRNDDLFDYRLEFQSGLSSVVQDDTRAIDLEDETIYMLGNYYTIARAEVSGNGDSTPYKINALDLLAGDVSDTLEQGQTRTYTVDGEDYEVTILIVGTSGTPSVRFLVNGETSRSISAGDTDTVAGIEIGVRDVISSQRAFEGDQGSIVEFYLGANKIRLQENGRVEFNDENVRALESSISSQQVGDRVRLNSVELTIEVDPAFRSVAHLAEGESLRPYLRDAEALLNDQFDIEFHGLSSPAMSHIEFNPQGDDEYQLSFTNTRGDSYDVSYVSFKADNQTWFGDEFSGFVFHEALFADDESTFNIRMDDYFVVNSQSTESRTRESRIFQFIDVDTGDNQEIEIMDAASGSTITASYDALFEINSSGGVTVNASSDSSGQITISGRQHDFWLAQQADGEFRMAVDLDNDNQLADGIAGTAKAIDLTVRGGGILTLDAEGDGTSLEWDSDANRWYFDNADGLDIELKTLGAQMDEGDDVVTTWNIRTQNVDDELRLSGLENVSGAFYAASVRNADQTLALDQYGAEYTWDNPSGSAQTLTISYPHEQREALVYVVGGDVQRTTTSTGGAAAVNVLDVGIAVFDEDVSYDQDNMIVVGGPCANTMAAQLLGNPSDCTEGFTDGMGMIRSFDTGNHVAVLVAGSTARDTVESSRVLARAATQSVPNFSGDSVEVVIAGANDVSVHSSSQN